MNSASKARASRHRIWWQLLLLLLVSTLAVFAGLEPEREFSGYFPESTSMPSVFNRKPSGYSALSELAGKVGFQTHAWQLPYRELPKIRGTLIIVEPSRSLDDYEIDEILRWVEAGNNLVYLDDMTYRTSRVLAQRLKIQISSRSPMNDFVLAPTGGNRELAHVSHVVVTADSRLFGGQAILPDAQGSLVLRKRCGDGNIILGVVPNLCENSRLVNKTAWPNFQFMINCLATMGNDIWFDELCHGYSRGVNVFSYLGRGPLGLIFLQLLLLFVLAFLSCAQRFGPAARVSDRRASTNLQFIEGLANTYQKAEATDLALEVLDHALRLRLSRALGVPPQSADADLAQSWSAVCGEDAGELSQYLVSTQSALSGKKPSAQQLVELAGACDKISEHCRKVAKNRGVNSG